MAAQNVGLNIMTDRPSQSGRFMPCPAAVPVDPEEWRKTLAVGSAVYHREGGRGVIVPHPAGSAPAASHFARPVVVEWDSGPVVWWETDELWPTASPAYTLPADMAVQVSKSAALHLQVSGRGAATAEQIEAAIVNYKAKRMRDALDAETELLGKERGAAFGERLNRAVNDLSPESLARLYDIIRSV
jgi:hypothetical protein